jgi:flagellin
VDVATESTNYAKYQILVQSGTSMLAQANQNPQSVLKLLQ